MVPFLWLQFSLHILRSLGLWTEGRWQVYSTTVDQKTLRHLTLLYWSHSHQTEVGVSQTSNMTPLDSYHENHQCIGPALKN